MDDTTGEKRYNSDMPRERWAETRATSRDDLKQAEAKWSKTKLDKTKQN